jgi:hypothetical protein
MLRYFVAGNAWLLFAMLLFVTMTWNGRDGGYGAFGTPGNLRGEGYRILGYVSVGVSTFYFVLYCLTYSEPRLKFTVSKLLLGVAIIAASFALIILLRWDWG